MACEYCYRTSGHSSSCPNYVPNNSNPLCIVCEECIDNGEEYIENDLGICAHIDCLDYVKDLVDFLGYEIKTMGD